MTHQTADIEWTGHNMQRVAVTLEMRPDDYRRVREAAQTAQVPELEFYALAVHKGVKMLMNCQADVSTLFHPLSAGTMK